MLNSDINFGVGCFRFLVKKKIPGQKYFTELSRCFESITNISNINIVPDTFFSEQHYIEVKDYEAIENSNNYTSRQDSLFLAHPGSDIDFDLYIPRRFHHELNKFIFETEILPENYRVVIKNSINYPAITFIYTTDPDILISYPSQSVILIRSFLESEFEKINSDLLKFEILGPSPFHADFFLKPNKELFANKLSHKFKCQVNDDTVYKRFTFSYDPNFYRDIEDALSSLFKLLKNELGVFYMITHHRVKEWRYWDAVQNNLDIILKEKNKTWAKKFFRRYFILPRLVENVIFALTDFESDKQRSKYLIERAYYKIVRQEKTFLKDFIQEEISDKYNYPTTQTREILNLIETRRSKFQEALVILISALIGGSLGAIITILASIP